jgi:hypothetical protein
LKLAAALMLAGSALFHPAAVGAAAPERLAVPDIIYVNGKIYTGTPGRFVNALAVKDGKVLAAGSAAEMRGLAGAATVVDDLEGKTVLPGLYDNHVHIGLAERGGARDVPDLHHVENLADLQAALKKHAATVPAGTWIRSTVPHGTGGVEPFPETALPTRWQLDQAVPDHPVALTRGAHIMLVNSKALELAGITRDTPQPGGGVIERNAKGEPNGVLREASARRLITVKYPPDPPIPEQQGLNTLRARLRSQLALGVTSLNVPGMRPHDDLRLMQKLYAAEGDMLPRATIQLRLSPGYDSFDDPADGVRASIEELEDLSFYTGFGNDRIKIGAIKMSVDGGMGGQAAWLLDPYRTKPGYHGVNRIPPDALFQVAKRAHDLGWQLGIHAIGDQGIVRTVDVMDRIMKESPRPNARHYLHHLTVKPPADTLAKIKANDFIAAMQPNFTYSLADFYRMALSPEKLETNNAEKSFLDLGIRMSLGTDGLPDGPLVAIYAAVTRRGIDGKVYGPGERLTLEQAIYNATVGTAYMTFDEKTRGTLEPGKVADMIVLDKDIFAIKAEEILNLEVEETIIAGKVVWKDDGSPRPTATAWQLDDRCVVHDVAVHCHSGEDGGTW